MEHSAVDASPYLVICAAMYTYYVFGMIFFPEYSKEPEFSTQTMIGATTSLVAQY